MPALNNDQIDDALTFETQESFAGGEDDYRRSTLIDPDQCQRLVNVIVRDNYEAWTRPGADAFAAALAGPVRSLTYFDTPNAKYALAIANGGLQACSGKNAAWSAVAYTPAVADIAVEMVQGVDKVLISDGVNRLALLDDQLTLTTCGNAASDPPIGANILCWHTGRMFAAGFSGIGGSAVPRDTIAVSNRLSFGNGQWNLTTRSFRVGGGDGDPITALHSLQGFTLAVFKQNSIWLCQTDPTAEPPDFAAQTVVESLGFGVGCVGKRAVAAVANDVFFMAQDGVRSLQRMQSAAGQWQLSAPLSQPVQRYINRINKAQARNIVATAFKEFVLFAIPLDSSAVNNAVLVFNTRLGKWLGCWTGWTPAAFARARFGTDDLLLFGDNSGKVNYWKEAEDSNNAATYTDNSAPIPTTLWTRAFLFGTNTNNKSAYNCALRFTAGSASINLKAMLDLQAAAAWSSALTPDGDILGVGKLGSFKLASVKPVKLQKSLRSLPAFYEMYLELSTTGGFIKLRSLTLSAFENALDN